MTREEYYAIVKKLGLTPDDKIHGVFWTRERTTQSVTDPRELDTPDQVRRAARLLVIKCGQDPEEFGLAD
jgi:hypothetical protein